MTILSYILGGIVLVYTVVYAVRSALPIMRYKKCVEAGELRTVTGTICEKVDEENRAIQRTMVNLCLPKFEFEIEGKKRYYQSAVRYQNASIGQPAEIGYCERTGEAWVMQDIPLMKKSLVIRTAGILAILALMVVTDMML